MTSAWPADIGHIYVTTRGADPTGAVDCTAIINKIISDAGPNTLNQLVLYYPPGTYTVSGPLASQTAAGTWLAFVTHQVAGRALTTIKLADGTYTDPAHPQSVIYTASKAYSGGPKAGGGNEAFHNFVFDLTVDAGDNPGAIGIDFVGSNVAAIRRVTVIGNGVVGINCTRSFIGPAIFQDVAVDGFSYGLDVDNYDYSLMLDQVTFAGQAVAPVRNGRNVLGIDRIVCSKPLLSTNGNGLFSLYRSPGATVAGAGGGRVTHVVPGDGSGYTLVPADTPVPPLEPLSSWANAHSFPTLQAAVDSGAAVVYFPAAKSNKAGGVTNGVTVTLPPTLKRLIFMDGGATFSGFKAGVPVFRTTSGSPDPLVIERGYLALTSSDPTAYWISHGAARPLVVRDITLESGSGYTPTVQCLQTVAGCGPVYLDDTGQVSTLLAAGVTLYGRQVNCEGTSGIAVVHNVGGQAWLLGLKTEGAIDPIILTEAGGHTELLAGYTYPVTAVPATAVGYGTVDSTHALQAMFMTYNKNADIYTIFVQTSDAGVVTSLKSFPARGYGAYVSHVH